MVVVAFSLPSFVASPLAGVIVDRFDRRRVLVVVSFVQAVAAFGLLGVGADTVWVAFVCQSAISALAAVVKPAIEAGTPESCCASDDRCRRNARVRGAASRPSPTCARLSVTLDETRC